VAKQFIPSDKGDANRTLAQLRYLKQAAASLEKQLLADADLPSWVKQRIAKSAADISIATSYIIHLQEKQER